MQKKIPFFPNLEGLTCTEREACFVDALGVHSYKHENDKVKNIKLKEMTLIISQSTSSL